MRPGVMFTRLNWRLRPHSLPLPCGWSVTTSTSSMLWMLTIAVIRQQLSEVHVVWVANYSIHGSNLFIEVHRRQIWHGICGCDFS